MSRSKLNRLQVALELQGKAYDKLWERKAKEMRLHKANKLKRARELV